MIVVADASPLIFLAKVRKLDAVHRLLGGEILLPKQVRHEVLVPGVDAAEKDELQTFLESCRVEIVHRPRRFASAMSRADNAALTLAVRLHANLLLCDERIIRRMAEVEGIRPLGTLGVLLRALRQDLLDPEETRKLVDLLVQLHGFRIGIELYQSVLAEIEILSGR